MSLVPAPDAGLVDPLDPISAAIAPLPPELQLCRFGITQQGQLYAYGPTPAAPQRILQPDEGLQFFGFRDCTVINRTSRDYLDLRFASVLPHCHFILSLPCQGTRTASGGFTIQWPVRSLLGALTAAAADLDLSALSGKLRARRGSGGVNGYQANFIDLLLPSPAGELERCFAEAIGPSRDDLAIAVNSVRRALNIAPQFL